MTNDWRERLKDAWKASGRSKRDVSRAAGLGAGFLHEVLSYGKNPSIENLMAVAAELKVSTTDLLEGERR